jgi:hypothetical protein
MIVFLDFFIFVFVCWCVVAECAAALLQLEFTYYKFDAAHDAHGASTQSAMSSARPPIVLHGKQASPLLMANSAVAQLKPCPLVHTLAEHVYTHGDQARLNCILYMFHFSVCLVD